MKFKTKYLVFLLILIGTFLRFYNLNWGSPYYFHPDERNIANAVTQLNFPLQMNPHFFAYGSLPIYLTYFTGLIVNFFTKAHGVTIVPFEHAILIGRVYSSLLSTLLIPLLYFIGKRIDGTKTGLLAAFLATFSTGFIQFAHFGTFEMWLTCFSLLFFWFCLKLLTSTNFWNALKAGLFFGILISIKVSSIVLAPLVLGSLVFGKKRGLPFVLKSILLFIVVSGAVYALTNPFSLTDFPPFQASMKYESSVVFGTQNVFYTQGFYESIPIVFQLQRVYPFLLNPLLTILFVPTFFYLFYKGLKTKNQSLLILNSFFLILFLSQAILFAKWTRYMVPTLPFIYLLLSIALVYLLQRFKKAGGIMYFAAGVILFSSILFGISYFITAFLKPDTRVSAAKFAESTIPPSSSVLTEPYDLGGTAFPRFASTKEFNFYELDSTRGASPMDEELKILLESSDYFISPSQRLFRTRLHSKKRFPKGHEFYTGLQNGSRGFEKIYQTPCDIFCNIAYLGDPVFRFEETAMVFDRPTVFIFKKVSDSSALLE